MGTNKLPEYSKAPIININKYMNFDETVNKILHEAHFNSPYEKATGIKRQVEADLTMSGLKDIEGQFSQDKNSTEFRQREERIAGVIERAAQDTAEAFAIALQNGTLDGMKDREVAKRLVQAALEAADTDIPDDHGGGSEGTVDGWNLPHYGKLLKRVGELTTGKAPMSQERIRNIILQGINNVKSEMGMGANQATAMDGDQQRPLEPFEDPKSDKYIGPR